MALTSSDLLKNIPTEEEFNKLHNIIKKYNLNEKNKDLNSIKDKEDFFFLMSFFNAQEKANEIEKYLIEEINCKKIKASLDKGDCVSKDGKYIEIKTSTTNKNNFLNIRQIRPWQKVDYYLCSFINERNLAYSCYYFLTKQQMLEEIEKCGSYTHGTKKAARLNTNKEYSISFPVYKDNEITKRWNTNYKIDKVEVIN
jgi:hypothetical protein